MLCFAKLVRGFGGAFVLTFYKLEWDHPLWSYICTPPNLGTLCFWTHSHHSFGMFGTGLMSTSYLCHLCIRGIPRRNAVCLAPHWVYMFRTWRRRRRRIGRRKIIRVRSIYPSGGYIPRLITCGYLQQILITAQHWVLAILSIAKLGFLFGFWGNIWKSKLALRRGDGGDTYWYLFFHCCSKLGRLRTRLFKLFLFF